MCLGGAAFYEGVADLSEWTNSTQDREPRPARFCDMMGSGIASYSQRAARGGLLFTRPIFRSSVAAMLHAPLHVRSCSRAAAVHISHVSLAALMGGSNVCQWL